MTSLNIMHCIRDITTFTMYMTAGDLKNSFSFNTSVKIKITDHVHTKVTIIWARHPGWVLKARVIGCERHIRKPSRVQLGVWRASWSPPSVSGAEPRPPVIFSYEFSLLDSGSSRQVLVYIW